MTLRVDVDTTSYLLELQSDGDSVSHYRLDGASGSASVSEVMPGVYSVLDGSRSFTVHVASRGGEVEVWTGSRRFFATVSDERDRSAGAGAAQRNGPLELRTQMPGKVVKVLVAVGAAVTAGQGLVVVEAMKMQNEVKSPRDGVVTTISAVEGATVGANEPLVVIE